MNFVVLYCIKNQYEMIEEYVFKHSPCDFSKVDILIYDDGSESEQINKLKKLCDDFKNISWINENEELTTNPVLSSFERADNYLNIVDKKVDWILFFENDVFPFQENFWDELDIRLQEISERKDKHKTCIKEEDLFAVHKSLSLCRLNKQCPRCNAMFDTELNQNLFLDKNDELIEYIWN